VEEILRCDICAAFDFRKVYFRTRSRYQKTIERLQDSGIETFESCEGGKGHAYPEPAVRFNGGPEAGWRALSKTSNTFARASTLTK
jgi:hypothetical protein